MPLDIDAKKFDIEIGRLKFLPGKSDFDGDRETNQDRT